LGRALVMSHQRHKAERLGARYQAHPRLIKPGQLFWPLEGRRRRLFEVKEVRGPWVRIKREDGTSGRVTLARLLSLGPTGRDGQHYRFHGWRPRQRGYRTALEVLRVDAGANRCVICLPEWDPDGEIEQPLSVLPAELRHDGALGSCMADLSAVSSARLNIHACRSTPARGGASTDVAPPFRRSGSALPAKAGRRSILDR
jgi:hypothetical protein